MSAAVAALASALMQASGASSQAQTAPEPPGRFSTATVNPYPARPADVESLDAIMRAVYDVISGPAGQKRDWDRMRSLFVADARLMPKAPAGLRVGTVEDYIATSGPILEQRGFIEKEIAREAEQYGDIAHVFSTYEARNAADGPVIMRGINSFQLVRHGGRWWVVSIMWQQETPQNPIPPNYLGATSERG
ncbi:MAG TPA: hypothetical protein VFK58_02890 [Sphingomicrobium sp.]|nr:hypothetical protein [Sphingomicrobium sp.]